jgi:pimeloyl-ACP methyl ester carboxylesterase
MAQRIDLSFLDRPEVLEVVFPLVYSSLYPSFGFQPPAEDFPGHPVEIERGIGIDCGFWASGSDCPSILYFHGNGETVAGYNWIAPLFNRRKINLFVTDYRGYGTSTGTPTIANMLGDAHIIFESLKQMLAEKGFSKEIFVMGRSLGSMPAIELASSYQGEFRGLIIESGTANNFRRLWASLGIPETIVGKDSPFLNRTKIRGVTMPTLIIHGEYDQIIPITEGIELYQSSGAEDKDMLVIPGADHNNIMLVNESLYFDTIEAFVNTHS